MLESVDVIGVLPGRTAASSASIGPKRQEALFGHAVQALDAALLIATFFGAYALRDRFAWSGELLPIPFSEQLWAIGVIVALWLLMARAAGLTDSHTYLWPRRMMLLTCKVHLIGGLLLLSSLYLLRAVEVSRLFVQLFLVLSGVALVMGRAMIRRIVIRSAARSAAFLRQALVVGATPEAARFDRLLNMRPHWGCEVAGFLLTEGPSIQVFCHKPVLGRASDLETLLDTMILDEVVIATPMPGAEVDRIVHACAERGLTCHTLVHAPAAPGVRHHAESLGAGLYLMSVERTPQSVAPLLAKRAIDVIAGAAGMMAFGLAYIICGPLIKLSSAGPVIFKQTRVGQNGRFFTFYKFRTMRSDAETQRTALAAANQMRGHLFKMDNDPRVTPFGRLLRRFYIDELPQFWNVLKGDMSLVGPRPPLPEEVAQYAPYHRRRLSVRPGITGPWQTKGNGAVADFEEVVRLECEYIDQWSLRSDISLLLQTCVTVIRIGGH